MVSNPLAGDFQHGLFSFGCHDAPERRLESPVALRMSEDNLILSASEGHAGSVTVRGRRPAEPVPQNALPEWSSPPLAMIGAGDRARITLEIYDDLAVAETEWESFERHADCTVFQTYGFLAAWQRHVGTRKGTVPAIVMGRDEGGRLLFILQLAVESSGLFRRLTWLGSDLCDYNAPLLDARFFQEINAECFVALWHEVIAALHADPRFRFDCVDLQKMPETVGAQTNPFVHLPVLAHPSGAYVAQLGGDWNVFYAAKRSASTRKKERKQLKQLGEYGEVRFVDVDRADRERTLATLLDQKSHAFAHMGVEDIFARPGYREFFQAVATDPDLHDLTHMSRLDIGATVAAANLGLRFRDCYYLIVSSYHDGEFTRFGPGRAHLNELLSHAIETGFRRFDFTVGDEPYKRDWSDTELRMYDYLAAVTLRGRLLVATSTAFRRAKRFIKQTPALWHAFSRGRELVSVIKRH
jgi:CelD/BcsL family acetyltransferase involved in cellulose biosynthesis